MNGRLESSTYISVSSSSFLDLTSKLENGLYNYKTKLNLKVASKNSEVNNINETGYPVSGMSIV